MHTNRTNCARLASGWSGAAELLIQPSESPRRSDEKQGFQEHFLDPDRGRRHLARLFFRLCQKSVQLQVQGPSAAA
jgi:hypothetical protein